MRTTSTVQTQKHYAALYSETIQIVIRVIC